MDGKEWGGCWLRKCSRAERPWRRGCWSRGKSHLNSHHDGVGGKRHGERLTDLKDMVGVFNIRGKGFDNGLEVGFDVR